MGKLILLGYQVKKSFFERNAKAEKDQRYVINPNIAFNISVRNNNFDMETVVKIEESEEKKTPFNIEVVAVANFKIEEFDEIDKMRIEASEIFYPYVRTIVSNLVVNANMNPYFLPFIDFKKPVNMQQKRPSDSIIIRPIDEDI